MALQLLRREISRALTEIASAIETREPGYRGPRQFSDEPIVAYLDAGQGGYPINRREHELGTSAAAQTHDFNVFEVPSGELWLLRFCHVVFNNTGAAAVSASDYHLQWQNAAGDGVRILSGTIQNLDAGVSIITGPFNDSMNNSTGTTHTTHSASQGPRDIRFGPNELLVCKATFSAAATVSVNVHCCVDVMPAGVYLAL